MKNYEVCYFVKEVGHEYEGGQWETYAETDDVDEAYEKYADMRAIVQPGDFIEDDKHYVDEVAIYARMDNGTQELLTNDF